MRYTAVNIPINRDCSVGGYMFNPFRKDTGITENVEKRKEKQEERRQRAQARGQKPIK